MLRKSTSLLIISILMFSSLISVVSSENSESAEYLRMYEKEVLATDVELASMAVDPLGYSHYTYISNDNELTYLTDSSGDWESSLVYTGDVYEHVIVADSAGNVHIAFSAGERNDSDLVYKTNKGGWDAEVIDKVMDLFVTGATIDIALDNEDNVHIAYIESSEKSTNQTNYEGQYIKRLKHAKIGEDGTWVSSYVHDENYSIDVHYPTISVAAGYVFFGYTASYYDEEYSWFSDGIAVNQQGDEYHFGSWLQMDDSHPNTRQSSVTIEGLKIYMASYSHSLQKIELSICDIGSFSSCSVWEIATSGAPNDRSQIDVVPNEGRLHLIYSEIVPKTSYNGITTIHWSCNLDQQGECNGGAPESRSIAWTGAVGRDDVNTGPSQLWYSDVLYENANIGIKSNQVVFSGTSFGELILYREVFKLNGCKDSSAENYDPAAKFSVTTDLYSGCTYPPMQEEPLAQDEGLPGFQISTFILAFAFAIFYRKQ